MFPYSVENIKCLLKTGIADVIKNYISISIFCNYAKVFWKCDVHYHNSTKESKMSTLAVLTQTLYTRLDQQLDFIYNVF